MSRQAIQTTLRQDHVDRRGSMESVRRFGLTERFAHWWTVSMVSAALLTGLGLGDESYSGPMLTAHVTTVVLLGVGLITALIVGDTRSLLKATRELFAFDRRDIEWVRAHLRRSNGSATPGEWGMFNPGQKALAWALTAAFSAVIYTGIVAWRAGGDEGGSAHSAAVVVAMVLVGSHIFMAVVNPSTRPALAGMVRGRVPQSWAAKHHAGWLHEVERSTHTHK